MTRRANRPCGCGSGKSLKKCHRDSDRGVRNLIDRIHAGEIPFSAQARSSNGEPLSMKISQVAITRDGVEKVLLEEELTISTNTVEGDTTMLSAAAISLPVDGTAGTISTFGNATISNATHPLILTITGGGKKLKAKSKSGAFVVARLCKQRETQHLYFDFLFGIEGQDETVDESGRKDRSHISLYPDGTGKFLRLTASKCEIFGEQAYSYNSKQIIPKSLKIRSSEFMEILEVSFLAKSETEIELVSVCFL